MDEENMSFEDLLNSSMEKQNKKLGKVVTGKVISVSDNGEIFLDIDYKADGIIPKNEFSFDENENPNKTISSSSSKKKISFSKETNKFSKNDKTKKVDLLNQLIINRLRRGR